MTTKQPSEQDKIDTLELVKISVDGEQVIAARGRNLLEALLDGGVEVSSFCYHPCLSIAAQCRQCLVGLGDGQKLVPACQLTVEPGMKIRSNSEDVLEARRALLEYTLLNHPIDCVICDKAGECTLQRHYMDWDAKPALGNHEKVHKPKKVDLGPHIMLDAERCIMCSRCIRFCTEVAKQPQLVFSERGNHTVLTTAPGERLDNPYSINTVDICPVGALTDKGFRFRSRVWDLFRTRGACNGCAAACELEIHHKGGEIYRLVPPKRWDMNLKWMCDYGRGSYGAIHAAERLAAPLVDGNPVDLDAAITQAASLFNPLIAAEQSPIALVIGADATNEDNYSAVQLAGQALRATVYLGDLPNDDAGDDILRRNDPNPNRFGARACCAPDEPLGRDQLLADLRAGSLRAVYVVGDALGQSSELVSALGAIETLVVQATRSSPLTQRAKVVLPAAAWAEVDGSITDYKGGLKRLRAAFEPPGFAKPHWALICALAGALGHPMPFASAFEIFAALRQTSLAFEGAAWGEEIPTTLLRWGGRRG